MSKTTDNSVIIPIAAGVAAAVMATNPDVNVLGDYLPPVAGGVTAFIIWALWQKIADTVKVRRQRRKDEQAAIEREREFVESRETSRPNIDSEYAEFF